MKTLVCEGCAITVVAVLLPIIGCTSKTPTAPTPATILITPVIEVLVVGTSATLSANDEKSGQELTAATWSSSNESVISVTGNRITAVAPGTATITARHNQSSASISLRSIPNYAGRYDGGLFVVSCQDSLVGFCASNVLQASRGQTEPMTLTLTQSTLEVTGRMLLRGSDGLVSGTIDSVGRLRLAGTVPSMFDRNNGPAKALEAWSSELRGSLMFGTFNMRIFQVRSGTPAEPLGTATVEIRGIERVP